MLTRLKTINSFTLAMSLVLALGGVAYGLTQVTQNVSATVDVQVSAPNGIEIYLDAARTLPADSISFGTVVVDPFGTPANAGSNPEPVWVENQSNSTIELTLTDDFDQADVVLAGSSQAPILQPGEVLPVELFLNFRRGEAGTHPFTVSFQAEGPVPPPIFQENLTILVGGWGNGRFDSALAGTGEGNNYARILHGFPIASSENGAMIPGIATDWAVSDDGLTWTVNIRDGVKFHDGTDLTAADVAWSWEHEWGNDDVVNYSVSATSQTQSRITELVEQTGTNQVSATLNQIASGFPSGILAEAGPNWIGHILPKRDAVHNEAAEEAYDRNPIGAGPMKLTRHIQSEVMSFERFDDFYYRPANGLPEDRRVQFATLDLRLVPEESTRVAALRSGEADIVTASLYTRNQIESGGGRLVFGQEGVYFRPIFWGCWRTDVHFPCADKRVRQAFAYALDKDLIRDRLYGGPEVFQTRGWQFVTPSSLGYSQELDPFPYDPDLARQLLTKAGFPGGEGFGPFIVNTWVSTAMPLLPESAQLAADMWRNELGIEVEVRVGNEGVLNRASRTEELHGQMTWRDNEARLDGASILLSSYGSPDQGNRLHEDASLYDLIGKNLEVVDPAFHDQALNEVYRRLHDEQYEIGVGYSNIPWGVGPRIESWTPRPMAFYPSALHTIRLK